MTAEHETPLTAEHETPPDGLTDRIRERLRAPYRNEYGVLTCAMCGGVIPVPPSKVKRVALGPTCRCPELGGDAA